jgi:hypothetical protein
VPFGRDMLLLSRKARLDKSWVRRPNGALNIPEFPSRARDG